MGLTDILKRYGRMEVTDRNGEKTVWVWDAKRKKAVKEEDKK